MHGTLESALRVEWRPFPELAAWVAQWRELAGRAVEPNIFYEPAFALAAAPVFGHDVGAGLVWSRGASPSLLGFFPARVERRRYGIALPILVGWTHPYAPLGAPLVEPEMRAAVIEAWLDFIARDAELPKLILLPYLPEGLLADTIDTVLSRRGGSSASFARHARALLSPLNMRAGYLERSIHSKNARSCAGSVSVSLTAATSHRSKRTRHWRWRTHSKIFLRSKCEAGRGAPAPPLAAMTRFAGSWKAP